MSSTQTDRAELFRLLGDEHRLQILALCAEEPLTVSELAELLRDSQPQLTRKTQPLRHAGLLTSRKDGTRTYLSTTTSGNDAVLAVALEEGRRLCRKDKSLARLPRVLLDREARSRQFFDAAMTTTTTASPSAGALAFLPMIRPLLGGRQDGLCVDVGAGDGALLPVLSPLFGRVFAVDRSPVRLASCARVVADHALGNVRLLEGDAASPAVYESVFLQGGASVVVVARTLHHAARPAELLSACARLLKDDGLLLVVDYLPHDDEALREQGDVWMGFSPSVLARHVEDAGLVVVGNGSMPPAPGHADSHLDWQWTAVTRPRLPDTLARGPRTATTTPVH